MKKLAIVILNWNGQHYLEKFLPALLQNIPEYAEVIIADNNSTDNSISFLESNYPPLRIIQNGINGGFSKGYNDAFKQINTPYYCLLNSDIEVTPNWVEPIIELMEANENIAVVQPKILSFYEKEKFEYAGASGGFVDKLGYPFCRGRIFETLEDDKGQHDTPIEIFWATGAAMFVKSDIYYQLGGLDEDFFAHMEEIDFCWRVKNAGGKIMVNPKSTVYHVGGGTLPKSNSFKTFLNFRNNLFLLLKNLPAKRLLPTFIARFPLDILASFIFLLKGNTQDFTAVYKAWRAFLKNYKKMKKKRNGDFDKGYQALIKTSILFQYHLKQKKYFNGETFHN